MIDERYSVVFDFIGKGGRPLTIQSPPIDSGASVSSSNSAGKKQNSQASTFGMILGSAIASAITRKSIKLPKIKIKENKIINFPIQPSSFPKPEIEKVINFPKYSYKKEMEETKFTGHAAYLDLKKKVIVPESFLERRNILVPLDPERFKKEISEGAKNINRPLTQKRLESAEAWKAKKEGVAIEPLTTEQKFSQVPTLIQQQLKETGQVQPSSLLEKVQAQKWTNERYDLAVEQVKEIKGIRKYEKKTQPKDELPQLKSQIKTDEEDNKNLMKIINDELRNREIQGVQ